MKELTRVVTAETEDEWINAARGKTCGEVQAMVAGRKKGDGPDDPDEPDLRLRWLTLGLPPQSEAMYRELLAAIDAEMGHRVEEAEAFGSSWSVHAHVPMKRARRRISRSVRTAIDLVDRRLGCLQPATQVGHQAELIREREVGVSVCRQLGRESLDVTRERTGHPDPCSD